MMMLVSMVMVVMLMMMRHAKKNLHDEYLESVVARSVLKGDLNEAKSEKGWRVTTYIKRGGTATALPKGCSLFMQGASAPSHKTLFLAGCAWHVTRQIWPPKSCDKKKIPEIPPVKFRETGTTGTFHPKNVDMFLDISRKPFSVASWEICLA